MLSGILERVAFLAGNWKRVRMPFWTLALLLTEAMALAPCYAEVRKSRPVLRLGGTVCTCGLCDGDCSWWHTKRRVWHWDTPNNFSHFPDCSRSIYCRFWNSHVCLRGAQGVGSCRKEPRNQGHTGGLRLKRGFWKKSNLVPWLSASVLKSPRLHFLHVNEDNVKSFS